MTYYRSPYRGGERVTCGFAKPGAWKAGFHIGVDLVGVGDKTLYPVYSGKVLAVGGKGADYGNHVLIKQDNGCTALYAHLEKILVKSGQSVDHATPLGIEGGTGKVSGNHLHLELHDGAWRYPPAGSSPKLCTWLLDPWELITRDKASSWAEDSWDKATKKGVFDGSNPKGAITREQVAVVLDRLKLIK